VFVSKFEKITSRENHRLARARKIRDGKNDEHIFIEGKRLAAEALRSPVEIVECFVAGDFSGDALVETVVSRGASIATVSSKLFDTIAQTESPQGIVLIAMRPTASNKFAFSKSRIPITLYLNEINNPSNLGAVLRTAEAAGVANILISPGSADPFSPKALRASMGSAFRLNIATEISTEHAIALARENKLITIGADANASVSYADVDWSSPRMLMIGSEAHGLSEQHKKSLDALVSISMANEVESLNLAVSVGVILFEARRQNANGR